MNQECKSEETNKGQMTKEEHIKHWLDISDDNYKSMINMFKSKEYMWSLFVGHLVLEKLLKAYRENIERIKELRNWLREKIGKQYTG
jgi:HEPN domain-containing protein